MYEIWLALNILFEIMLANRGLVIVYLAIVVILFLLALRSPRGAWGRGLRMAIVIGLGGAVIAFIALPGLTDSSFGNVGYWIDWLNLIAMSAGVGAGIGLLVWPLATMLRRRG
jgi:hypothetical protein